MKLVLAIFLAVAVMIANQSEASPLVNLPALPNGGAGTAESFQFKGYRILRRKDINACLIVRDTTPQNNERAAYDEKNDDLKEDRDLTEVVNAAENIKEICGSFKTVYIMNSNSVGTSASGSVGVERTFLNATDIIGSISQISQSLFGVWAFPGIGR